MQIIEIILIPNQCGLFGLLLGELDHRPTLPCPANSDVKPDSVENVSRPVTIWISLHIVASLGSFWMNMDSSMIFGLAPSFCFWPFGHLFGSCSWFIPMAMR